MKKIIVLLLLLSLSFRGVFATATDNSTHYFLVISKKEMTLKVYNANAELVVEYPIACGKSYGNKKKPGDMRTPEGVFRVEQIQDATSWTHDFRDGKGVVKGAYGPFFFRLKTGHSGIGIHGTHDPSSIGKRVTEGCIRLKNKDLISLKKFVDVNTPVIITGSSEDLVLFPKECLSAYNFNTRTKV